MAKSKSNDPGYVTPDRPPYMPVTPWEAAKEAAPVNAPRNSLAIPHSARSVEEMEWLHEHLCSLMAEHRKPLAHYYDIDAHAVCPEDLQYFPEQCFPVPPWTIAYSYVLHHAATWWKDRLLSAEEEMLTQGKLAAMENISSQAYLDKEDPQRHNMLAREAALISTRATRRISKQVADSSERRHDTDPIAKTLRSMSNAELQDALKRLRAKPVVVDITETALMK